MVRIITTIPTDLGMSWFQTCSSKCWFVLFQPRYNNLVSLHVSAQYFNFLRKRLLTLFFREITLLYKLHHIIRIRRSHIARHSVWGQARPFASITLVLQTLTPKTNVNRKRLLSCRLSMFSTPKKNNAAFRTANGSRSLGLESVDEVPEISLAYRKKTWFSSVTVQVRYN
jgi:hypothetical protein